MENAGGRTVLGDDILTSKHVNTEMFGGCPSGNVCPRGKSFPIVVPQEEVTDITYIFPQPSRQHKLPQKDSSLGKMCCHENTIILYVCHNTEKVGKC